MLQSIKVKDYMAANLTTFSPDQDVMIAVTQLIEKRISGAPVLDEHGNLVGMLSERDCVRVALETCYYSEQAGVVADYMEKEVHTIDGEMSILELAQLFIDKPYRRYPVVEGNRLVGQVSIRDVLRALEKISAPESYSN
ncbi:MAG: CBS domain-containing protein [Gammaproteobacteria bacterium]|nr:CBS domain-containing protein [Gammaproteobacteria bacterium]